MVGESHGEISCDPSRARMEDAQWKSTMADLQKASLSWQVW
jgi:hypothetical protein